MDFEFVYEKAKTEILQKIISLFVSFDVKVAVSDEFKMQRSALETHKIGKQECHISVIFTIVWALTGAS